MGRNHTGPPWSVGRLTAHMPVCRLACPPAALQMTRHRQTTTYTHDRY